LENSIRDLLPVGVRPSRPPKLCHVSSPTHDDGDFCGQWASKAVEILLKDPKMFLDGTAIISSGTLRIEQMKLLADTLQQKATFEPLASAP
jgi:hypothetical protein